MDSLEEVSLCVKNVDKSVDDEALRRHFQKYGDVKSAKVMVDEGIHRGFGFVSFSKLEHAMNAINDNACYQTEAVIPKRKPSFMNQVSQYICPLIYRFPFVTAIPLFSKYYRSATVTECDVELHETSADVSSDAQEPAPELPESKANGSSDTEQLIAGGKDSPATESSGWSFRNLFGFRKQKPDESELLQAIMTSSSTETSSEAKADTTPMKLSFAPSSSPDVGCTYLNERPVQFQVLEPITISMLAGAPPTVQKQVIGERLISNVECICPENADKVTAKMLEMDNRDLLHLLEDYEALKKAVHDVSAVLKNQ